MRKVIHPSFPYYLVREDGYVERAVDGKRGQKTGDLLFGRVLCSGYRQFKLISVSGEQRLIRANRLVCEAFHGPAPSAVHHAAHRNGDQLDNQPANLYWATPKENKQDAIRHGTSTQGETVANQHGPAKITAAAVVKIRGSYTGKRGDLVRLAREYGVYPTCIQKIVSGQTWRHVPGRSALDQRMAS